MTNNFDKVKQMLTFKEGTFYVFMALQRAKDFADADHKTMPLLKSEKQRLLKYWLVDSPESLAKYEQEMLTYCTALGGRLYMCTDAKSVKKALVLLNKKVQDNLVTRVFGAPTPLKLFTSAMPLSVVESAECSEKGQKYWLVDVDTKDPELLTYLTNSVKPNYVFDTPNGYHLLVEKNISCDDLKHSVFHALCGADRQLLEVKENALTLVFAA